MCNGIHEMTQWGQAAGFLQSERVKLKSYDLTLLEITKPHLGKTVLDYGAGPGVLASALQQRGAEIYAFDISAEMRRLAGERIGSERVYSSAEDTSPHAFDAIICNLVLCIVEENEVYRIMDNIGRSLDEQGKAYVGFCNPWIYDVQESQLDFRMQTGAAYNQNHDYLKIE